MFKNRIILVTGGTGSLGYAIVNRLFCNGHSDDTPIELRIFSRDIDKQKEMKMKFPDNQTIKFYPGSILDRKALDKAIYGVDYVIHAAAIKGIPYCEDHPIEAIETNVTGTKNLLDSASEAGVEKIVVISTDKACYPVSTMGLSKALMEKVAISFKSVVASIFCIRLGNLLGSEGTVVPLFINQILTGKNLTVTNPDMTRFMMTPDDAVDLVFTALTYGRAGDIIIKESPSASLDTLTKALFELYGTGQEGKILVVGPRPGERLYETMATKDEMAKAEKLYIEKISTSITQNGRYLRIPSTPAKNNTSGLKAEDLNSDNSPHLNVEGMKQLLCNICICQSS